MSTLITILGPTACGKTAVATQLAARLTTNLNAKKQPSKSGCQSDGELECAAEIISADSRQVFRGMDIGTGKDLADYEVVLKGLKQGGKEGCESVLHIPYHLIDIAKAGTKYSVFHFQQDFFHAFEAILQRGHQPILCGGTGLYIESVLRGYNLVEVPVNDELRQRLEGLSLAELTAMLATYKRLHNTTDVDTARRAIRAIEIEEYYRSHDLDRQQDYPTPSSLTIGLDVPRELRRQRITERLHRRLNDEGMVDEVKRLLDGGVTAESLISYGLEYRYLTQYILGQISYEEMANQLEIAIHQFAKRQMTYFRGMERRGVRIHWIDATRATDEIVDEIRSMMNNEKGITPERNNGITN